MSETYDIVVAGEGHNGLVAACYLSMAGLLSWSLVLRLPLILFTGRRAARRVAQTAKV